LKLAGEWIPLSKGDKFPRLINRGPIEARPENLVFTSSMAFPRLINRGPIEAKPKTRCPPTVLYFRG